MALQLDTESPPIRAYSDFDRQYTNPFTREVLVEIPGADTSDVDEA